MFQDLIIFKSGKELKDAAKARINANEVQETLHPDAIEELKVLARNLKDEDRYGFTVAQLTYLRM